jgi:hypothetical protein
MQTSYTIVEVWPGIALLAVFTVLALVTLLSRPSPPGRIGK